MWGKVTTAGITLFWLVMMGLLAQREIVPAFREARDYALATNYRSLETLAETPRVYRMGIYLGVRRIGQTVGRLRRDREELRLQNTTRIKLSLSPAGALVPGVSAAGLDALIQFDARIYQGRLQDFRLAVSSPPEDPPLAIVDGYPVGQMLSLHIRQAGQTRTDLVPFDDRLLLSNALAPLVGLPKPRVGRRWTIRTLDPATYSIRTVWAEVVGTERITIGSKSYDAYLIVIPYGTYEVKVWASPEGEILKQKVFGFVFLREEPSPQDLDPASDD